MILREIIPLLVACSCLSPIAAAQKDLEHTRDFSEIVVPITSVKITPSAKLGITGKPGPKLDVEAGFGTGFCMDAACRFIATNYHVAMGTRTHKIKGEKIFRRFLATGPQDKDATANALPNGDVLPFATGRDLAIFELRRSLPGHHGLSFSLDELEVGQEVDIYGYPKGILNPIRKLTRFPATFKGPTTSGLLAFGYELSTDKPIRMGGASGGIVVDRKSEKIVGILSGTAESMALAVPVQTLADFVSQAQPFLAQKLFPASNEVSPVLADIFVPAHTGLQHRVEESPEVKVLRKKAQLLANSMNNFIAVQTFEWGLGDKEPSAQAEYEVRVIDGVQRFREYPDGKKELQDVPFPVLNNVIRPGGEWSELPEMVGTELGLKIHQAADVVVNGQRMKVFQYWADIEDGVCKFQVISDLLFRVINKIGDVACYGEVWTDKDTNILRISEHLDLPGKWKTYQGVVTYGWLRLNETPRLIPLTIYTQAQRKKKVYWCRGQFTNYQIFDSRVKIIGN